MKMSVVGCEASGKTVFLSALADYYNGDGRPCLVPENESANNFQRFQIRQMRGLHQWPAATDPGKTIELRWTLRKDGDTIADIDMLEFGGETFREAFRDAKTPESHQAAVNALKEHLGNSEFIIVLVSLKDLLRDQGEMSNEEFERETEAIWVTRGLLNFLNDNVPDARIVIGLTQADLHRDEIAAAGGADRLFQQRWPSVASVVHGKAILPVASVSATDENGNPATGYTTDGVLPVMEEFRKSIARGKSVRKATAASRPESAEPAVTRRTILLIVLLLACFGLWVELWYNPISTWFPTSARQQPVVENVVQTNFVQSSVATTNVIERLVVKTNVITQVQAPAPQPAQAPLPQPQPAPAYRTWHDHNGTPIDARWISTSDDRKRIIIETVDGKRIRASVRKFSGADQQYIREQLDAKTGSTNPTL